MHGSIYRAKNMFSLELRYLYFFSDVSHLIKTVSNNLSSSGTKKNSRRLWVSARNKKKKEKTSELRLRKKWKTMAIRPKTC